MANLKLTNYYLCETAFFSEDKKLNIIGVFDILNAANLPALQPKMSLAGSLEGTPGQSIEIKIVGKSPSGKEIALGNEIQTTLSDTGKANFVANFPPLPLVENGKYSFFLIYEDKEIGQISFELKSGGIKMQQKKALLPSIEPTASATELIKEVDSLAKGFDPEKLSELSVATPQGIKIKLKGKGKEKKSFTINIISLKFVLIPLTAFILGMIAVEQYHLHSSTFVHLWDTIDIFK